MNLIGFLAPLLAVSVALNAFLLLRRRTKKAHPTQEMNDLIADLATGGLVLIRRIDPQDVLLRSPKRKA